VTNFHPDFLGATASRINLRHYPQVRQLVVQHLYPDTLRLLLLLHRHVPIDCIVGISYSGNSDVVRSLQEAGIRVVTPDFAELAQTIEAELGKSLQSCQESNTRLMIHEVGGYAIRALHERYQDKIDRVIGAIEVTKQGVWVAQSLPELLIPQLNCAQTRLKQIEGKMVGEAVVVALDNILRELGYAVVGRPAVVTGYGWVGKGAAHSLRQRGVQVTVFDTDIIKSVDGVTDGFAIARTVDDITDPAIVLGVSGKQSITAGLLEQLPDKCFLVSGASKDHEIDLPYLASISTHHEPLHRYVDTYFLRDGRRLYLVNKGFPVNFTGSSVPDEIVEFLFAELIMLVPELLDKQPLPGIYPLSEKMEALAATIWLDLR